MKNLKNFEIPGRSKVFAGMFAHNFQESVTNTVIVNDIKFEVFQELMRFVYSGKVRDMERVGFDLLQAAEMVSSD